MNISRRGKISKEEMLNRIVIKRDPIKALKTMQFMGHLHTYKIVPLETRPKNVLASVSS